MTWRFTLDTHGPDYLDTQEGQKLPVPPCLLNSGGLAALRPDRTGHGRSRDMVIGKGTFPSCGWPTGWRAGL